MSDSQSRTPISVVNCRGSWMDGCESEMESVPVWMSDWPVTRRPSGNRSLILSYLFSCFSCMYLFIFLLLWISDWLVAGRPVPSVVWVIRREPYSSHPYTLTCLHPYHNRTPYPVGYEIRLTNFDISRQT
jgi:hypothetical protein